MMEEAPKSEPSMKSGAAMSDEEDAAQDLLDAVKGGDAKAVSLALRRHYELCKGSEEGDYEED